MIITVMVCGILGASGLVPQAPLHVYSLATIAEVQQERQKGDVVVHTKKEVLTEVYENR